MNTKAAIGAHVRKRREALGLTREQLCEIVDLTPEFISQIERGIKGPSAESMVKLCNGMSVSADYLLFGKETATDISEIAASLENIDPEYLPLVEEHIKTFIKTIGMKNKAKPEA